jgi:hypothetical protein
MFFHFDCLERERERERELGEAQRGQGLEGQV